MNVKPGTDGLRATMVRELADGPRQPKELRRRLHQYWSTTHINYVRRQLGVISTNPSGRPNDWWWSLPKDRA